MIMRLDLKVYPRVAAIQWLSQCGQRSTSAFRLPYERVGDRTVALHSMFSARWGEALDAAKGRLTEHLAVQNYGEYGHWNTLVAESRDRVVALAEGSLAVALRDGGWPASLGQASLPPVDRDLRSALGAKLSKLLADREWEQSLIYLILLELNLAAMEISYRSMFRKAPLFFEALLEVYEAGHVPCGWDGDPDRWPEGKLLVH
jgi:hypothetical protein